MIDKERNKGGECHHYKLKKTNKRVTFDIINDISEYITLVQLVDTVVNVNHAVSISGFWIYYLNYEKEFPFLKESLHIISYCSYSDEMHA